MSFGPGDTDPSEPRGGQATGAPPVGPHGRVTFERRELNRILRLYGRKVAAGEWCDYAIDFLKDRAVFSVLPVLPKWRSTGSKSGRGRPAGRAPTASSRNGTDFSRRARARPGAAGARPLAAPGRQLMGTTPQHRAGWRGAAVADQKRLLAPVAEQSEQRQEQVDEVEVEPKRPITVLRPAMGAIVHRTYISLMAACPKR